ncbi:MAG: hypothetical protein KAG96_07625 [Ichthyobacteriaceae bacterium]|nr:hypothetical protein [Ichthyobacteriaceae bacterium]
MNLKARLTTIATLFLALNLSAQLRTSLPNYKMFDNPAGEISSFKGWMFNAKGTWISKENIIPINSNKKNTDLEEYTIGQDNAERYILDKIASDNDTMMVLVKLYDDGKYTHPQTKIEWNKGKSLHYYIIDEDEMFKLNSFEYDKPNIFSLKLYDGKDIKMKGWEYKKLIPQHIQVDDKFHEQLMIQIYPHLNEEVVQFMFYQWNPIYNKYTGIVNPLKSMSVIDNKKVGEQTVLLDENLFSAYYYETSFKEFNKFFPLFRFVN